ncbi:hypothetical protein NDU88_006179 [Pleurodeles waltl]|uniref:Uncharacterized protein n=1 Tax=Pleurodeles waltl TaxID=8319 RepID=A0AAV7WA12_PLEWA|nr:hypothetical protein NDU88_006179 [Pleurodeles waltl]
MVFWGVVGLKNRRVVQASGPKCIPPDTVCLAPNVPQRYGQKCSPSGYELLLLEYGRSKQVYVDAMSAKYLQVVRRQENAVTQQSNGALCHGVGDLSDCPSRT